MKCQQYGIAVRAGRGRRPACHPRAFSLVELMIVMIIIAIVIALIVPALGNVRDAAKRAATQHLLTDLTAASGQFSNDNSGRPPGYFAPRQMGSPENWQGNSGRGMSAMENIGLDVYGGIVQTGAQGSVVVGPTAADTVSVNPDLIGVKETMKVYFTPDPKFFVPQRAGDQQVATVTGHADVEGNPQLPDVVDAWGDPILAWVEDDTPYGSFTTLDEFVLEDSGSSMDKIAAYYYASNACFLNATSLGKMGRDQTGTGDVPHSALSGPQAWTNRQGNFACLLGNPSYPNSNNLDIPAASRGLVFHSAGRDGFYVGSEDRGFKQFSDDNTLLYRRNFENASGDAYRDDKNRRSNIDVMREFDDVFVSGGGK